MPDGALQRAAPGWRWWWWLAPSAAVVFLDLFTKAWVADALQLGDAVRLTSWFNLVRAHNTGAAFSFLADAGGWQRGFFIVVTVAVSVGILVFLRRHAGRDPLFRLALALVLGGALGNLHDRVRYGYVIDFVQWHYAGYAWPAFNVADAAISCGVVLMLIDSFRKRSE
jgi:signal peptidase II